MSKSLSLQTTLSTEQLVKLNDLLIDLAKLDLRVRFKIENSYLICYAVSGEQQNVYCFKYFKIPASEIFQNFTSLEGLDLVIADVKKLCKQLKFYEDSTNTILMTIDTYDGSDIGAGNKAAKNLEVNNEILRTFMIGGESYIIKNISLNTIAARADASLKRTGFILSNKDFDKVKKLLNIDSENEILEIGFDAKNVKIRERGWELKVSETNYSGNIFFKKKYLNNVTPSEVMIFDIFDSYLIVRSIKDGVNSEVMITLELES